MTKVGIEDFESWKRGLDKAERKDRERAKRRRAKMFEVIGDAVRSMYGRYSETEGIRNLLAYLSLRAWLQMDRESDAALLAEIEAQQNEGAEH